MATLKLEDLLGTPTGRQMVTEHEEAQTEKQAQAETQRAVALAETLGRLSVVAPAYAALRDETLPMLETLSLHVGRLLELRNRLRELASLVHKQGGKVLPDFPVTLMGTPEFKQAVAQARDVMGKVGGAL